MDESLMVLFLSLCDSSDLEFVKYFRVGTFYFCFKTCTDRINLKFLLTFTSETFYINDIYDIYKTQDNNTCF